MRTRPEGRTTLVLEGAMNEKGPWKELSLYHSPGRLEKMPAIIREFTRTFCVFVYWLLKSRPS